MSKQRHQSKHQHRHLPQHSESTSDRDLEEEEGEEGEEEEEEDQQQRYDPLANLLSLKLRKPNHWNWELSTSRSCSNIALPRILLYDHTGALLLDADGSSEQTYRPIRSDADGRRKRAATANLEQSLRRARLPGEFDGLRIGEATASSPDTPDTPDTRQQLAGSCIEFSTHELPDWQPHGTDSSRRSSSLRGVRFDVQDQDRDQDQRLERTQPVYPTPPSTSTLTTTANSSSSGPREKRRYRRSHSHGQRSILERLSMSRGRHSSPEYVQEQVVEHGPRYFLRSSKAGTLVIKDESINRVRQRRRRPRHSSSENVLAQQEQKQEPKQEPRQEPKQERSPANSVVQVTTQASKRHQQQLRSREALLPSSDEETAAPGQRQSARQSRCRRSERAAGKDVAWMCQGAQELITVDPGNCVYRAKPCATRR